jgi:hypothetical protein
MGYDTFLRISGGKYTKKAERWDCIGCVFPFLFHIGKKCIFASCKNTTFQIKIINHIV